METTPYLTDRLRWLATARSFAMSRAGGWLVALVVWVIGALLGSWWQVDRFVEREHGRFRAEFDAGFAAIVQRLDQNEAVLAGLVALLRSSRDPEFPELRQYADEMLRRYPHLYTIGYQPRVALAQREAFEARMAQGIGRPFRIRDFSFEGERRWRESPPRPFYFPVTFMAPKLANAQDVIGYDVYADRPFRDAIDLSGRLDRPVAAAPFELFEGGRGYIFLRALHLPAAGEGKGQGQGAAQHLISLLVHADRLLAAARAPAAGRLSLRHREAQRTEAATIGGLGEAPPPVAGGAWPPRLPDLVLRRSMPSAQQPFELDLVARPRWQDAPWQPWGAWLGAWTALVAGSFAGAAAQRRLQRLRHLAQQQSALARQDLAAAEQRAEAARVRSLDELGSGIAHELNQPLTAVVGYSQAALRLLGGSTAPSPALIEQVREALRANAQQALRAGDLMQRLRALVHRQPVRRWPLRMQDVVANALRLEQARIDAAGAVIDTLLPEASVTLQGDTLLLEQLLTNLLRNALDALAAMPAARRRIVIELGIDSGLCRLKVSDNGPGLSDEQLARAFHPFQSTKPSGIGIGLVVCAAIAEAHGGDIRAEHAAAGGACFVVTLALTAAA